MKRNWVGSIRYAVWMAESNAPKGMAPGYGLKGQLECMACWGNSQAA